MEEGVERGRLYVAISAGVCSICIEYIAVREMEPTADQIQILQMCARTLEWRQCC